MNDFSDPQRCSECGGKCCKIYLGSWEGGTKPAGVYFEEWVEQWDEQFAYTGADKIKPLFDPLEVHLTGNEHLKRQLLSEGLDPDKCKYCGIKGCILPRDLRPKTCREFRCKKWRKNEH